MKKALLTTAVSMLTLMASAPTFADVTGSATITNNYIWRGLTQTINDAAFQGGLKATGASGLYAGTWVSNASYDAGDVYSYEHDVYFGFSNARGGFTYDVGYVYYNYDANAAFDFGEAYATLGFGAFSVNWFTLINAQGDADDFPGTGWEFDAFGTNYFAGNLNIPLESGATVGLHMGYHEGDFAEAFNGVTEGYFDYNVSIAKDGFMFMVTGTDLDDDGDGDGVEDYASMAARDNDAIKFVASYSLTFEL